MSENVVILGSNSGIARPLARLMAARGCRLVLAARNADELERQTADLRARYNAEVFCEPFDATNYDNHPAFIQRVCERFDGALDGVVLCYGELGNQSTLSSSTEAIRQLVDVNVVSAMCLLEQFAAPLEKRGRGYLCAISSVAGERGRQSNYTYGATKAALTAFLSGLRNRLHRSNVHVITIKPGQVDTPMTQGIINPHSPLVAQAEKVAADIDRAIRRRRDVAYTPGFWRLIMAVIRAMPEWLFKRLKL